MSKSRLAACTLTAVAALAACDAPATAPDATVDAVAASSAASASSAPATAPRLLAVEASGPDRFQSIEFLLHLDAERERLSVHAPSDFCTTFRFGVVQVQEVTTPSAIEQRVVQLRGDDLPVAVYEANSFADAGFDGSFDVAGIVDLEDFAAFCAFLVGPDRIAEGTVRRVSNLSNASFSVTWTGTLERVEGGRARLTELYQLTADAQDPGDNAHWSVNASKVLLH